MKITDLLDRRSVEVNGSAVSKEDAINKMVDLMCKSGKINDKEEYKRRVFARETEGSTGIGEGIAIPHAKCDAVTKPGLAAMVVKNGVDFDSLDGEKVSLIFLIAAPDTKENVHKSYRHTYYNRACCSVNGGQNEWQDTVRWDCGG